ncbi:MAG: VOC family protein [Planctomycetota bacterium]
MAHVPGPFHLAIPVTDLEAAREFYATRLGCAEGRSSERWIDFDFWGHQLVVHLAPHSLAAAEHENPVDGDAVPIPHFGVVMDWAEFHALADRLRDAHQEFVIEPRTRFEGQPGEQATMFLRDPAGNAIECKAFRDPGQLFAT